MPDTTSGGPRRHDTGDRSPLGRLGHHIAHHPWHSLGIWILIAVVCLLPAANVGAVINGTFSNPLPSTDESVLAQNALDAAFPNATTSNSSEIVLLESRSGDITGPSGRNATIGVARAIESDHEIESVGSVESLYSAYEGYLVGEGELGWGFLAGAIDGSPSLLVTVNGSASLVWTPEATYLGFWESAVAGLPEGSPPSAADWPAYNASLGALSSDPTGAPILSAFYDGPAGFNASLFAGRCTSANVSGCVDDSARANLPSALSSILPLPEEIGPALLALGDLGISNWTQPVAQEVVAVGLLGPEVGLAPEWLLTLWHAFPGSVPPSGGALAVWAAGQVVQDPLDRLPLPIPSSLYSSFVNRAATATLLLVSFNVSDSVMVNGQSVTYQDSKEIQDVVSSALAGTGITPYETGSAPLDGETSYLATSALSLLLLLTILVLVVIMFLYFRAPAAPLLAFGMIAIALLASLAGIYVVGKTVTTFNSEIESIILVFLMSIGTDYSVFLLARYREELVKGTVPKEAIETTVRWAGQSIATSGLAVLVVAGALMLSGISFLYELGICLFIAVAFALVVNLTVLPAVLSLVGPRIFWPNSGERFERYAQRRKESIRSERDYIGRAGRAATRRPLAVIALILVLSAPVIYVALQVPVSYDITNIGLPADNPAQVGFVHLTNDFGQSYFSPSFILVNFSSPVLPHDHPNVQEFQDIARLAGVMNATQGISEVTSLVGPGGAPLGTWLNFSSLPPALNLSLQQVLGEYVGVGGISVLFNIQTHASGYSAAAISVLHSLKDRVDNAVKGHPEVRVVYFGGAAPTTQDIQSLVNQATEGMLIGAAIGLLFLMLLILGSAFVPLLALGVIGLSILWSWAATYFVVGIVEGEALIFLLPLILLILVMGLGMDYNVLLLTRVKEERARGNRGVEAIQDAVTHAGGVITAAAVILGGAFLLLGFTSPLGLLAAIGLGIGFAVLLQAFVVQLFFTPAVLAVGKDRIWKGWQRAPPGKSGEAGSQFPPAS